MVHNFPDVVQHQGRHFITYKNCVNRHPISVLGATNILNTDMVSPRERGSVILLDVLLLVPGVLIGYVSIRQHMLYAIRVPTYNTYLYLPSLRHVRFHPILHLKKRKDGRPGQPRKRHAQRQI